MGGRVVVVSSSAFLPSVPLPQCPQTQGLIRVCACVCACVARVASPYCLPLLTSYPAPLSIPRPYILVLNSPVEAPTPALGASWPPSLGMASPGLLGSCWEGF